MNCLQPLDMSDDPHCASKFVVDLILNKIWPLIQKVRVKLQEPEHAETEELAKRLGDLFTICCSQLNKCIVNLFQLFKLENKNGLIIKESRQCTLERISWCMDRLNTTFEILETRKSDPDESFLATPMYFVNWIDHVFEILTKLSNVVYNTDYRNTEELFELWKSEVVEIVGDLHLSLDELLLSAMTLCRYCLPSDQHIVRARCQVVLREAKALLTELINEDLESAYTVTKASLKLPIMPSNMNVLIDVLKDALYVLETNTNTALLALLVHCFSKVCPAKELLDHLTTNNGACACFDDCEQINQFDLHNERLMQIGTFAVSCSSDQNRISSLRSGLASLEALDPHLVPALILSPLGAHASLMLNSWKQEVKEIRDNVFLIVDPAAFAEKCKQMMHEQLLLIISKENFVEDLSCGFANVGGVVLDFFNVYMEQEPEALLHKEKLIPIVADLNKAQTEIKIVINMLSSKNLYKVKMPTTIKEEANVTKLTKRLKLVYTLVSRINSLFHPKEIDDQLFEICEPKNATHLVMKTPNIGVTYVNTPKKEQNCSRTFFARTTDVRSPSSKLVLSKLKKHLDSKRNGEFNFSVKFDETSMAKDNGNTNIVNKNNIGRVLEKSILYHSPMKNKSLRKAVLSRHCNIVKKGCDEITEKFADCNDESDFLDATTSLQITEILDQMNDMSNIIHHSKRFTSTSLVPARTEQKNVLKIGVNKPSTFKKIWNIPVNSSTVEMRLDDSLQLVSDASGPSDVSTQGRMADLGLVESRLSKLKMRQRETTL